MNKYQVIMMRQYQIINGDCRDVMRELEADTIHSIVSDPPYGLSFMGKGWDYGVPGEEFWHEALRVAKPGAHLLAFGGTRTYHRLACAIEDAGWEIRDCVMWVYGSGFPKSHDVSKAIDKVNGEAGRLLRFTAWMRTTGLTTRQIDNATGTNMGGHYLTAKSQPAIPTPELWQVLRPLCGDVPAWVDELVARTEAEREVIGQQEMRDTSEVRIAVTASADEYNPKARRAVNITAPATDAARQWQGWGTALKPAWEPVIVARKPLVGTVAENVQQYSTGAINVDGGRIAFASDSDQAAAAQRACHDQNANRTAYGRFENGPASLDPYLQQMGKGRWPANVIHDGSDEVVGLMGEAARFFYCAKASKADRDEGLRDAGVGALRDAGRPSQPRRNHHPTVKPTDLMRYLCRLVTPPGGLVLDPFCGSGSTGKAAVLEGFQFIGIEREAEYAEIARARIAHAATMVEDEPLPLLELAGVV